MDDFELPRPPKAADVIVRLPFNLQIRRKVLLYSLLGVLMVGLLLFGLISQGILGSTRVASVSLSVVDDKQAAIENARVEIGGVSSETAADGSTTLQEIARGEQTLSISKTGYLPLSKNITLKRGSNDLGALVLEEAPVEKVSVTLSVKDYISETAIEGAIVVLSDIDGIFDATNKVYKLNNVPVGSYDLKVTKAGFSNYSTKVTVTDKTTTLDPVLLVSSGAIVFESNRDRGKRGIFTANYDGSDQKALVTRVGDLEDYTPVLGPNQRKVFFTSTRDGVKRESDPNNYKEFMYVVDLDGKNLTKIGETSGGFAVWSPDGGYIGYTRYTDETYAKSEVYTYDVVAKKSYQFSGYNSFSFSFSPDGKTIAFGGKKDGEFTYKLFLAYSNGTSIKEVATSDTENNFYGMEFSNGTLRFSRYDTVTRKNLWFEYTIATGATVAISAPAIDRESAVLSPDKKLRAYVSTRDGKTNIYISDADSKNEKKLTDLNRVVGNLLWSKDSSFIMFDYRADGESGRYLISTNGTAKAKKIVDINLTYYY
jgi:Tol biopolymer transport system component